MYNKQWTYKRLSRKLSLLQEKSDPNLHSSFARIVAIQNFRIVTIALISLLCYNTLVLLWSVCILMVLWMTCLIVLFDVCRLCSLLSYFTGTLIVCVDLNFDDVRNFERLQWHINSSNPNTCCKTLTYGTAQINSVDDRFSCLFGFFFIKMF